MPIKKKKKPRKKARTPSGSMLAKTSKTKVVTGKRFEYLQREREVRSLLLKGTSPADIRTKMGLTRHQFDRHYTRICKRWEYEETKLSRVALAKRVAQHEYVMCLAIDSFEKSRGGEEITTKISEVRCPNCKGLGYMPKTDETCKVCKGRSKVEEKSVIKKSRGLSGDPSFLKEFRENLKCITTLEDLKAPKKIEHTHDIQGHIEHDHQNKISDDNQFKNAPNDLILEMMSVLEKVEEHNKNAGNGEIIDVQLLEKEKKEEDEEEEEEEEDDGW